MRSTRRLLVALVAGVIAAGLFIVLLTQAYNGRNSSAGGSGGTNAGPQVSVVVAVPGPGAATLPAGTKLAASNLALESIPQSQYTAGSNLSDTKQAIGQYISVSLPAHAPILQSFLLSSAPSAANTVSRAPLPIDAGMEAIGIPYDTSRDVGGYIQPGDHIDIIVNTQPGTVAYSFQDVLVLRVNAPLGSATTGTLVVEMTPQKAAVASYIYLIDDKAVVRLLLRSSSNVNTPKLPGVSTVNPGNWQNFLDAS